jgi:hypothetical protein
MHRDVDQIAGHLASWAGLARAMPPSFRGGGDRIPIASPNGGLLGFALPGEGVYLDVDLVALGVTRPISGVYERSPVQRFLDRVEARVRRELLFWRRLPGDKRGVITTYDGILASRAGGKADDQQAYKATFTTTATTWFSAFRANGFPGAGSYTSGAGATHNNASAGALSGALTNPSGGDTKYLLGLGFSSSSAVNMAMLVDVLVAAGGISTTTTSAQSIGTPALTRYTTGAGVMLAFDVTTALGASAANISASYTNQAGTSGQTAPTTALATSAVVQTIEPALQAPLMPLAAGDYGVRAVASVTVSANMGSGALGLFLYKPMTMLPGVAANVYIERDLPTSIDGAVPLQVDGGGALGCLALLVFPSASSSGNIGLYMKTCAG